jgi:antitoxin (DNA-binding transcriptional repressor) of toxin-antitoxin stability system
MKGSDIMTTVTATDLARRTNQVFAILARGEEVTIRRNNTVLGTLSPPARATTLGEALKRLPRMPADVAARYKADIRDADAGAEVGDPWQR